MRGATAILGSEATKNLLYRFGGFIGIHAEEKPLYANDANQQRECAPR